MSFITRLANGLSVATVEMPHMASVSLGLWAGVGGRFEPAVLNGVSHFIEHMLFKGTRKRTAREISQAVEGIGGYLNAFTTEESTCFFSKARYDRFEGLLEVLVDMFLNSTFDPGEFEKERKVIKEELAMYLDQPQHQVQEILNEMLWPDHPLGRPLTGTEQSLDKLQRDDLVQFKREKYVAGTVVVAAAGNIRHRQLLKAVGRFAPRFPRGDRPTYAAVVEAQTAPVIRLFTKETEQTQLALGIRVCSRHDERRYALRLLNTILGENMSSRLFQVVREDRGLAYSICSSVASFADAGLLTISAGLDPGNLPRALKLITRELKRLREDLVSPGEFRRARDYVLGQIDLHLENTENQMMWLGDHLIGYGKVISAAEVKRRLSRVTPGEIRSVARTYLRPSATSLALVSPLKSKSRLGRFLRF